MSGHHKERRPVRRRRLAWIVGALAACGVLVGGTVAPASPKPHSHTAEVVSSRKTLDVTSTKSASAARKSASPKATASASAKASKSATASASSSNSSTGSGTSGGSLSADLSSTTLTLDESTSYLQSGYNELPEWTRIDTEAAPNGDVYVAWQASDGIHVTPLNESGQRTGSDIVVSGAQEVGGLVALDDGFALLTRMADTQSNIWNETAAYLVRWESVSDASCNAGTCTGTFSGTHIRVLNSSGSFLTSDLVIPEHIAGDIAVLPNGSLMWTGPAATPSYSGALSGSGPTTNELTVAILKG